MYDNRKEAKADFNYRAFHNYQDNNMCLITIYETNQTRLTPQPSRQMHIYDKSLYYNLK